MLSARNRTAGQATLRDVLLATPPQVVAGRPQHGRPRSLAGTWAAGVRRFGPLSFVCRCFGSSPATKRLATYPPQVTQSGHTTSMDPHRSSAHWLTSLMGDSGGAVTDFLDEMQPATSPPASPKVEGTVSTERHMGGSPRVTVQPTSTAAPTGLRDMSLL
ncbi:hypothetical protein HPB52_013675 [Rhipicephalus sanguineus]|uniref:Uncharacterized protein n=1 Tax=Rhipicephalus sanguineus TaxID=34632 RepID=A0A9D4PEE9_RHISA|nr:hypothetical protein HPB52_013675 [Rhipicephalus sanguineus]